MTFRSPFGFRRMIALSLAVAGLAVSARAGAPDLSTPKSAAKAFFTALQKGDVETVKAATKLNTDAEKRAIDCMAGMFRSFAQLDEAAAAKFGDGAKGLTPIGEVCGKMLADIEKSTVKTEGGKATFSEVKERDLVMGKVGDQWKFDPAATEGFLPPAQALEQMEKGLKAIDQLTTDLKSGKFKTVDDLKTAIRQASQM